MVFLLQDSGFALVYTLDARSTQPNMELYDKRINPVETEEGVFRKHVQLLGRQ